MSRWLVHNNRSSIKYNCLYFAKALRNENKHGKATVLRGFLVSHYFKPLYEPPYTTTEEIRTSNIVSNQIYLKGSFTMYRALIRVYSAVVSGIELPGAFISN